MPELLKQRGLTQTKFAELLGVSDALISQVISGKKYFSYPVAAQAAYILRVNMEDLYYRIITK